MVDWSTLPKDLLALISKSLESSFDLIKFRSVCSSWRSAAEPKRPLPTHCLPLFPDYCGSRFAVGFCLLQWRILLIKPHESLREADQFGWLIKVQEDFNGSRKVTLLDLSRQFSDNIRGRSIPQHFFPYVLDMSKFKVRELGREVKLRHLSPSDVYADSFYLGKAVVKYLDSDSDADYKFVLLTINDFQKLAVFRSWDRAWTVIDDMPSHSRSHYHDVILFDGRFFAVDTNGRTVVVDYSSLKLKLAAGPVFGVCYKKYLIESCGEMLLVNIYSSMNERTTCRVFKYVEREKSWVEVYDLWDKMLFLGAGSNFSVSASDILPLSGGSSVFFHELDWDLLDRGFSVIDFSTGKRELVHKLPKYAKLFWPPPPWITSHERAPARSQYPNPPRMRLVNHSAARTRGGRVAAAGTRGGRVAAAGTRGGRVAAAGTRGGRVAAAGTRGGRVAAAGTRGGRVAAAETRGGRVAAAGTRGGRVAAAGTRGGRVARRQWRI